MPSDRQILRFRSYQFNASTKLRPIGTSTGRTESQMSDHDGGIARPPGRSASDLDEVDYAILEALSADGRASARTLAEQLHISRSNAHNRIARLRAGGVLTGFTASIDPHRAGLGTSAYVLLTVEQPSWRDMTSALREIPYVEHIALVAGEFDVLVLVRTPDNATLREVVLERIQAVESVRGTHTWLIFEESAGRRSPWSTGGVG